MLTVDCCQNGCEVYYYLKYVNITKRWTIRAERETRRDLDELEGYSNVRDQKSLRKDSSPSGKGGWNCSGKHAKIPPFEVATRRFARESSAWGDEMENVRSPDLWIPEEDEKGRN